MTRTWAPWTPEERELVKRHYLAGGAAAVQAAGVNRTRKAIKWRASVDGVFPRNTSKTVFGPDHGTGNASTLSLFPARPKRITDALHALAETPGLTEREYLRRKAEILEAHT